MKNAATVKWAKVEISAFFGDSVVSCDFFFPGNCLMRGCFAEADNMKGCFARADT